MAEDVGFAVPLGAIAMTECQMVNQFKGSATEAPCFTRGYGLAFGQSERKTMSMALVDRTLRARELGEEVIAPAQDEEFVMSHSDNVQATGFVEHLKLPHYVDFQSELGLLRKLRKEFAEAADVAANEGGRGMNAPAYNFAYLDEQTKRMIRRAILKAIAIPGYQVPFASREMPMPYGWGTGGVQVTAAILGPRRRAEGDRPGLRRHHERDLDPEILRQDRGRCDHHLDGGRDRDPDQAPDSRSAAAWRANSGLSGADPRAAAVPRAARDRDAAHACARRIRPDARQAVRGHRALRPYRDLLRLSGQGECALCDGPVADAEIRQPEDGQLSGAAIVRGRAREADLRDPAAHDRGVARFRGSSLHALPVRRALCAVRGRRFLSRRDRHRRQGRPDVRLLRYRLSAKAANRPVIAAAKARRRTRRGRMAEPQSPRAGQRSAAVGG